MEKNKLTPEFLIEFCKEIPNRIAAGKNVRQKLADGNHLYLNITNSGKTSWVLFYNFNGRPHEMGLGRYPDISLYEARERAATQHIILKAGISPLELRNQTKNQEKTRIADMKPKAGPNYESLLATYIQKREIEHNDNDWAANLYSRAERYIYPFFKANPIDKQTQPAEEWTYEMALAVLEQPVKDVKTGKTGRFWVVMNPTAKRVMDNMMLMLRIASAVKGWNGESRDYWESRFELDLPNAKAVHRVENFPSLPYCKMPEFIQALRENNTTISLYLEFLILTIAARSSPTLAATWDQMHFKNTDNPIWIVPRESVGNIPGMKSRKNQYKEDFIIPLVPRAVEHCLGHISQKYNGAYNRANMLDMRREILEIWAAHCEPHVSQQTIQENLNAKRAGRPTSYEEITVDELTRLVWSKPLTQIAAEYGVSDVAVGKWCKRLGIQRPSAGFWRKVETGILPHPKGVPSIP